MPDSATISARTRASRRPDLVCPAGSLRSLTVAVEAGADAVYLGLKDATNARNFAGLNFDEAQVREGIALAHHKGVRVLMALNTFADARSPHTWFAAADKAAELGVDALIVADTAVMGYCRDHLPGLRLHLSVQASATTHVAIEFYRERYGVRRAVLPRVVSAEQVARIVAATDVEIEVFAFGSLCVMVEGRCALSSYATGASPNNAGVCSPASAVRWQEGPQGVTARLNGVLIDRFAPDEPRGYPTLCKGRFQVDGRREHVLEEPTSLNTLDILPDLMAMGVRAFKIEGRQRSAAYVGDVTRTWRAAIDRAWQTLGHGTAFEPMASWHALLARHAEGAQTTLGAFERPWR